MSASATATLPEAPSGSLLRRIAWHWRHDPKRELWIAWWTLVVFYNLYGLLFFVITRTQPPPQPSVGPLARSCSGSTIDHYGLLSGSPSSSSSAERRRS